MQRIMRLLTRDLPVSLALVALVGGGATATALGVGCPPSFAEPDVYESGKTSDLVMIGDLDLDADLDIVVMKYHLPYITVLLNTGDGTFVEECQWCFGAEFDTMVGTLGDVDGDGDLDIVTVHRGVLDEYRGWITIYRNGGVGSATFSDVSGFDSGDPGNAALGDVDGDGDVDMVVSNGYYPYLPTGPDVVLNNGDGTFAPAVTYTSAPWPRWVALGDLNGDGELDIASVGWFGLYILMNDGEGSFLPPTHFAALTDGEQVELGDLDGDGSLDIVVKAPSAVRVLRCEGGGEFADPVTFPIAGGLLGAALADMDGDGDLDVTATNGGAAIHFLLNHGGGSFAAPVSVSTADTAWWAALGDLDADGHVDIAAVNPFAGTVSVLLNTTGPCCPTDWNGDGVSNSTDVSSFINDWFTDQAQGTTLTDWDANGVSNSTDVSGFINSWFEDQAAGCGG